MPCTTILVGKKASADGSTLMARNEDSGAGHFMPKKCIIVRPEDQPVEYKSVLSKFSVTLPANPLMYSACPNAVPDEGIWGEAGINAAGVAMSEPETITSNARVLGADPLVKDGIGEEDLLTIVLPYIHSAREGVQRLGSLLEKYGTYEMNGIGFQDVNEIWWFESVGGHHWIAKRVPDDAYVVGPNQLGIDRFDFVDAGGEQTSHMCSADLVSWIEANHLNLSMREEALSSCRDWEVRPSLGSHDDADHVYNTPRAWFMERCLNPHAADWDGDDRQFSPESDTLPWSMVPEHKISVEDVKYLLSSHYQGTPYDPYAKTDIDGKRGKYRSIGVNRTNFLACTQIRPGLPKEIASVQWLAFASNVFNAFIPFYTNVTDTPAYIRDGGPDATTENFYWENRIIGALADAHWASCANLIERYQNSTGAKARQMLRETDEAFEKKFGGTSGQKDSEKKIRKFLMKRNEQMADMARKETQDVLNKVLFAASSGMKNQYSRSDA